MTISERGPPIMDMKNLEPESTATEETVLIMIHKRIRKRESYDLDSDEVIQALEDNGYPMSREEVMSAIGDLREESMIRCYEDTDDLDPETGKRGEPRITRYWGIEITPEGALRAIAIMNRFRTSW